MTQPSLRISCEMWKIFVLFFVITAKNCLTDRQNETRYYDEMITDNIKKSIKYVCPHDNSKFYKKSNVKSENIKNNEEFDFVIIGAGTAGAVIANRLSEISKWKILLIEAGDYEDDFSDIPFAGAYTYNSERNWCYLSYKYKGKSVIKLPYVRGKSIGGSTAINGLVYTRGNKEDYNKWASLGNPGWSYNNVLPYFRKLEKSYIEDNENFLGKNGRIPISYTELVNISAAKFYNNLFVEGAKEIGINYVKNYNGPNQLGISQTQFTEFYGKRVSTGRAYLSEAKEGLKIITNSLASKILIENNTAIGVEFMKNGKLYSVKARKEVIVSAGVINSPQILILSGIGPKEDLKKLKIKSIANLPVGKNTIEQFFLLLPLNTQYKEKVQLSKTKEIENFLKGRGVLTNNPFFNSDTIMFHNFGNSSRAEIEFVVFIPLPFLLYPNQRYGFATFSNIFVLIGVLHPKSRGEITLKSSNPKDFPKINLKMFSNLEDVTTLYNGIKLIKQLTATSAFKKYKSKILKIPSPCSVHIFSEWKYWECFIKHSSVPFFHMVGSNKMGANPEFSVVNNELKVHSIKSLRVADASVIPVSISGHTASPSIMVGEKAADLIKIAHSTNT